MLERQYRAVPVTLSLRSKPLTIFDRFSFFAPEARASARKSAFARKARLSTSCNRSSTATREMLYRDGVGTGRACGTAGVGGPK